MMASARLTLRSMRSSAGPSPVEPFRRRAGEGDGGHRPGAVQHPLCNHGDALGGRVQEKDRRLAVHGRHDYQVVGGSAIEDMADQAVDAPILAAAFRGERHGGTMPKPAVAGDRRRRGASPVEQSSQTGVGIVGVGVE